MKLTNKRKYLAGFLALPLLAGFVLSSARPALSWGGEGHTMAAQLAVRSLPKSPFQELMVRNEAWLARSSSQPDRWRNRPDASEASRHFFDTERFGVGTNVKKIPASYAELVKIRNYEQLRTDGIAPWAVGREYQLLVRALRENRWEDAFVKAAYLSHYAADSHVPFHASENYDGQLSQPSQKGIHSRFESKMLEQSVKIGDLKVGKPDKITDPVKQDLEVLQASIDQIPAILAADKEAVAKSKGEYNDTYWGSFTPKARPIAVNRLEAAGRFLGGLLQKAWEDAGKPTPPANFTMTDRLLPYAPAFVPRGETVPPYLPVVAEADKEAARKNVRTLKIAPKTLTREVSVNVILPKDYETSGKSYPVLYLLHGFGGTFSDWNTKSGIAAYAQNRPFIVVMPDGGNSWYLNTEKFGKVGDFFAQDLVSTIDQTFRTDKRREARAIAGLSMGGYGAWKVALDNPKLFCAAASLSGALIAGEGDPATNQQIAQLAMAIYGKVPTKEEYNKERIISRIEALMTGPNKSYAGPSLYFDIGKDDFLAPSNRIIEQMLAERGVPYEFAEFEGVHDWKYWDTHIQDVFQFVERQISTGAAKP